MENAVSSSWRWMALTKAISAPRALRKNSKRYSQLSLVISGGSVGHRLRGKRTAHQCEQVQAWPSFVCGSDPGKAKPPRAAVSIGVDLVSLLPLICTPRRSGPRWDPPSVAEFKVRLALARVAHKEPAEDCRCAWGSPPPAFASRSSPNSAARLRSAGRSKFMLAAAGHRPPECGPCSPPPLPQSPSGRPRARAPAAQDRAGVLETRP